MNPFISAKDIERTAGFISKKSNLKARVGLVLGSGLGALADEVTNAVTISYSDIPNWPVSTIHGHAGRLVIGDLFGVPAMVMQGRVHYYEGYEMDVVTLPSE